MDFFHVFVFYSLFLFVIISNVVAFTGLILSKTNPELSTFNCDCGSASGVRKSKCNYQLTKE